MVALRVGSSLPSAEQNITMIVANTDKGGRGVQECWLAPIVCLREHNQRTILTNLLRGYPKNIILHHCDSASPAVNGEEEE